MTFGALLFDVSADNFRPSRYNKVPAGAPGLSTPSNVCPHTSAHGHTQEWKSKWFTNPCKSYQVFFKRPDELCLMDC